MHLRLVSHRACPFVQRAVIVLAEKNVPHETEYVDLAHKPAWFVSLSPRGKVPVLVADGVTLFESAAICEYLEETHPEPPLMPKTPVQRARDRAWGAFASEDLFMPLYKATVATKPEDLAAAMTTIERAVSRLDQELAGHEFLSGDGSRFGMADALIAPFFVRVGILRSAGVEVIPAKLSRVRAYGDRVRARPSVTKSIPAGFAEEMIANMKSAQAVALAKA